MIIPKTLDIYGDRQWSITTAPTVEPITLAELELFGKIDGTTEDTLLENLIVSTRQAMERYLGRALLDQSITLTMDFWPGWVIPLPMPSLISVTSVATIDEDDTATTYSSDNYYVDTLAEPGKLILKQGVTSPSNTARSYGGYKIIYKAGYGDDAEDVPRAIRDALLIWCTIIYETRTFMEQPPSEVISMLEYAYRIPNI
jgi:uncharacterized phiE125 gp8 family phage protein